MLPPHFLSSFKRFLHKPMIPLTAHGRNTPDTHTTRSTARIPSPNTKSPAPVSPSPTATPPVNKVLHPKPIKRKPANTSDAITATTATAMPNKVATTARRSDATTKSNVSQNGDVRTTNTIAAALHPPFFSFGTSSLFTNISSFLFHSGF